MNLTVPTVGTESGPAWATEINGDLSTIDSHNHSTGQGVPIQPNGMNINADLPFNDNNATEIKAARFQAQSVPIPNSGSDVGELYVSGNELYYNDVTGGHQIKMTTNGSVNGAAGTISGLPSGTASAAYNAGVFTFEAATNTAANLDFASAVFRNSTVNSKGLTLQPPSAMAANITQTLPAIPGSSTSFMTMDTSGNMLTTAAYPLQRSGLAAVGQQVSSSTSIFSTTSTTPVAVTNLTVTITTTGRPVMIMIQGTGHNAQIQATVTSTGTIQANLYIYRGVTEIGGGLLSTYSSSTAITIAVPPSIMLLDVPSAGTYTYTVQAEINTGTLYVVDCVLVAYEL